MSNSGQKRPSCHWLMGVLLLATVGCTPVGSVHPLSDPAKSKVDERLLGVWKHSSPDGSAMVLIIGKGKLSDFNAHWKDRYPTGAMQCRASGWDRDHILSDGRSDPPVEFFPTALGTKWYANVHDVFDRSSRDKSDVLLDYGFWSYEVRGDELRLFLLNDKAVLEAVQKKEIAGIVKEQKTSSPPQNAGVKSVPQYEVTLTETTENLQKFLKNGGDAKWFPRDENTAMIYHRMK